jgi:hypothetical protein
VATREAFCFRVPCALYVRGRREAQRTQDRRRRPRSFGRPQPTRFEWGGRGSCARVRAAAACALATHATPTGPGPGAGVPGLRCCARTLCLPASAAAGLIFGSSACSRVLQECPSQSCSSTFISWVYVESLIQDVQRERPEKPECKMIRAYLDHIWIQIDRFHHSKRSAMKIK